MRTREIRIDRDKISRLDCPQHLIMIPNLPQLASLTPHHGLHPAHPTKRLPNISELVRPLRRRHDTRVCEPLSRFISTSALTTSTSSFREGEEKCVQAHLVCRHSPEQLHRLREIIDDLLGLAVARVAIAARLEGADAGTVLGPLVLPEVLVAGDALPVCAHQG